MTGVMREGISNAPKVSLGSKSLRMVDGKLVGADGLPVPSTDHGEDYDSSSNDNTPIKTGVSYASVVNGGPSGQKLNFRLLETPACMDNADVQIPMSSVLKANSRFENTLYGYFLGKRVAFPVVENYVMNVWKKYGITKAMMNAQGFFFFKFDSDTGLDGVLENGPWFIRKTPIVLKKWSSTASLLKEDLVSVPIWVKFHGVPIAAFTEDGLSAIASKLGTPLMLDSYTSSMCVNSWGRLDFARALIDVRADRVPKDTMVVSVPFVEGVGYSLHTVRVEYEWKPPRCNTCTVFGHAADQCPKRVPVASDNNGPGKGGKGDETKTDGFQTPRKPFKGLVVGSTKKVVGAPPKKVFVPKKKTTEVAETTTSNSFEALSKEDIIVDNNVSSIRKKGNQHEDSGKKVDFSAHTAVHIFDMADVDEDDDADDEDEILNPLDSEMADFMSIHDRKGGRKK